MSTEQSEYTTNDVEKLIEIDEHLKTLDDDCHHKKTEVNDIYKQINEIKYHNLKKYKSAGVLENEKTVIDEIIEYKKSQNLDFDYYENNKNFIDMAISKMQTDIICGVLTLEAYKLQVKKQLLYEENNIQEANKDMNLMEDEKEKIIERINKRIEILNAELMQEVEEDEQEEENKNEADTSNKENNETKIEEKDKANDEEEKKSLEKNLNETDRQIADEEIKESKKVDPIDKEKESKNEETLENKKTEEINEKPIENSEVPNVAPTEKKDDSKPIKEEKVIVESITTDIDTDNSKNKSKVNDDPFTPSKSNDNIIKIPESNEAEISKSISDNNIPKPEKSFNRQNSLISNSTLFTNNIEYSKNESLANNQDFQKSLKENVIYQILKLRFREYKAAYKYFRVNYCSKLENDAIKKASLIQKCIKALESANDVDESLVPIGVNPEYICDCSKKERHEIYSKLIKEINRNKKECLDKRTKIMADFQKMAKKDQIKKQEEVKKTILENDAKIKGFDAQIKKFMADLKNQWIPPPQYAFLEEEEKKERILFEIPENHLQINLESCNYDKQDAYCYIALDLGENRKFGEWVYINQFPKTILWPIDKNDQYTLYKKSVDINLYRTHWYWPFQYSQKGELKIKLESLKSRCEVKDKFNINLFSKRRTIDFDISIGMRTPLHEKEYITILHPKISITKSYPEFQLPVIQDFDEEEEQENRMSIMHTNNNHDDNRNPNSHSKQSIKPSIENTKNSISNDDDSVSKKSHKEAGNGKASDKQEEKKLNKADKEIKKTDENNNANNDKEAATVEKIDPSQFTKEELDDPEVIENLVSLKVLELKVQKLDLEIKKIEGRTPSDLRRKFLSTKVRWNSLKEAIEEGNLGLKDYIVLLQKQIEKDKKMKAYFLQIKETKKASIVNERLMIMAKELKEAMEHEKK